LRGLKHQTGDVIWIQSIFKAWVFPYKWNYPKSWMVNGKSIYKWMIQGYPNSWKPPFFMFPYFNGQLEGLFTRLELRDGSQVP
jgi:hypothetical protein